MAKKTEKTYKRYASIIERQRLAFALKFLKDEGYIPNYVRFLAKYKLRQCYIADLRRTNISMSISSVVVIVYTDYPIINKEWLLYGQGQIFNLQYRNESAIKENDTYERYEIMFREIIKEFEMRVNKFAEEVEELKPLINTTPVEEPKISSQNLNTMISYLMSQLSEKDSIIKQLKEQIAEMQKAVED